MREYFEKQKFLKILPIESKFIFNDIIMFHRIFYDLSVVRLPKYIVTYDRNNANAGLFLRQTRQFNSLDRLKVRCTVTPRVNAFKNSFFYRTHLLWNELPLELRTIDKPECFKNNLEQHLWKTLQSHHD